MAYLSHFKHADDVVNHLNGIVPAIGDPLLKIKYIGFVAVVSVTVYELAIKQIFADFANKKHKVFGNFAESYFRRINGRIKIQVIQDEYIKKFGEKYSVKFARNLDKASKQYLAANKRDIKSSYSNLITWRNDFTHEGKLNTTTTYSEVVQAYQDGKQVIHCLADTMKR